MPASPARSITGRRIIAMVVSTFGLLTATSPAHDFWIEPERPHTSANQTLRVRLWHGSPFRGDAVAFEQDAVLRFESVPIAEQSVCAAAEPAASDQTGPVDHADHGCGVTPVVGLSGRAVCYAKPATPGPHAIVYHTRENTSLLPGPRFEGYLLEEGLDAIIQQRAERGESNLPGREVYSRCAKALLMVRGTTSDKTNSPPAAGSLSASNDAPVGLPLEIVLDGLTTSDTGPAMKVRVLHNGAPLAGVRVAGTRRDEPARRLTATTDESGVAVIEGAAPGDWLITSLHMVRLEGRDDADWASFWTSLTFEITGAPAVTPEASTPG